MPGRLPDERRHEDRGIQADDVAPQLHHRLPPRRLDVVLDQDAEWSVVPGVAEATVDVASLKDDAPPLGKRDQWLHRVQSKARMGHSSFLSHEVLNTEY